ncbi:hypothetical protein L484_028042 [Morus notabilis]|uniref:Uncharacterized protein n=1 Tax=Morus notabilis TaxID=981085 RepID=W9SFY1_9ROSA|nr:hypothetical protein L484_028042 [Morus notabilis]
MSFAPIPKSSPEFPLTMSRSGIIHHLLGLPAIDLHTCQIPLSMFQDGLDRKPIDRCLERVGAKAGQHTLPSTAKASPRACRQPGLGQPPQSTSVRAPSRSTVRLSPFHIRPGRIASPHPLPS